jgi:lysophospholipase L1-like esterase
LAVPLPALIRHASQHPVIFRYSLPYALYLAVYLVLLAGVALAGHLPDAAFRRLLLGVGGGLAAVAVLEAALHAVPARWLPRPFGALMVAPHPTRHHANVPSARGLFISEFGEPSRVAFNADGLRGAGITREKPTGIFRILVLGDSFTEASNVPEEATFSKQLENRLNRQRADGRRIQVLNAGVIGYSPVLEYLFLKDVGLAYRPDVVLVMFFMNDPWEDAEYAAGLDVDGDGLPLRVRPAVEDTLPRRVWRALSRRVFTAQLVDLMVRGLSDWKPVLKWGVLFREDYGPREHEMWARSQRFLRGICALAARHGARCALAAIPFPMQVNAVEFRPGKHAIGFPLDAMFSDKPQRVLAAFAKREGIPSLDLLPAFREAGTQGVPGPLFFPRDGHFAPLGHQVTAQWLAAFLVDELIVPSRNMERRGD